MSDGGSGNLEEDYVVTDKGDVVSSSGNTIGVDNPFPTSSSTGGGFNIGNFDFGKAANAILGGGGGGMGAGMALGLGALAAALSRQQAPEIKQPEYKAAPVYNRALTAPLMPPQPAPQKSASGQNIYTPMRGMPLFFNPNPFQFDATEAAKRYGPTPEQIAEGQKGYEAGLASLYKPLSIAPITFGSTASDTTTGTATGTTTGGTASGATSTTTGGTTGITSGDPTIRPTTVSPAPLVPPPPAPSTSSTQTTQYADPKTTSAATVNVVNPLTQQAAKLPPAQSEAAARAAIAAGNTSFDQPGIRNIDIANIMSDIAAGGNNPLTMSSGELDRIVAAGKPAYERSIADPLRAYNSEFKSFLPRAVAAGLSPQQAVEKFGKDVVDYFGAAPRYSSANDAMSQVQGYIAARRAGNAGDMAKYEGRAQLLGINPRDFMGMVEAYAPDLFTEQASSDFYNRYYNPNTRLSDGLPGQLTFEGTSGWNWLKAQKEKYGLTNDQIAYAIGVEPSEVKKYLGMAEGGIVPESSFYNLDGKTIDAPGGASGGSIDDILVGYDGGAIGYDEGGDVYAYAKGQYLQGDGDGMSDSIPATINNKQPARLADGEFVVPADVVSDLGNGSSNAGAQRLHKMMRDIRMARHKTTKQPPEVNVKKVMPA